MEKAIQEMFDILYKEYQKVSDIKFQIILKSKKLTFTFDIAHCGILFLTRQENIDNWLNDIKKQLLEEVNLKIIIGKNDKLYNNDEIFTAKEIVKTEMKIKESFVLLYNIQKTDKYDLRIITSHYTRALFSITYPDIDFDWQNYKFERYKVLVIDNKVLSSRLYKEFCINDDIILKKDSDLVGLKIIPDKIADRTVIVL
jgi:hypothetical protein